eukprot:gnl/MRDRNA2_/MRDRNA2_127427_c0_seq1.p1 gnl/MRDRNA2_/MRDRNA2_127427_c0~~gnl/MRDRNA2_/MRDRNA2_127427_c0_seq1.p1  ORF type:complete len:528 (+),score=116.94 gnl/MRDRNA2_/MRDRNA2_127427_c0_seq1:102-1586(+)
MTVHVIATGELDEVEPGAFGAYFGPALSIPHQARSLLGKWDEYKKDLMKLSADEVPAEAAAQVLISACKGPSPLRKGLATKALLHLEAALARISPEEGIQHKTVFWTDALGAAAVVLRASKAQPTIQECGMRTALRAAAVNSGVRDKLSNMGWTRLASLAASRFAGTGPGTVAGWLLSLSGGDDPLVVAGTSDAWMPVDVQPDGPGLPYKSALSLPPGSRMKLLAFGVSEEKNWYIKLIDKSSRPVYELNVKYDDMGQAVSMHSGVEASAALGVCPFSDSSEPLEVVLIFGAERIEVFVDGKRCTQLDAANPAQTCRVVMISGLHLPHLWAQQTEEGGSTKWQIFTAGGWVDIPDATDAILKDAKATGKSKVRYFGGKHEYEADLNAMVQVNLKFGTERRLREPARRALDADGDPSGGVSPGSGITGAAKRWQIELETGWQDMADERQEEFAEALAAGQSKVEYSARGQRYDVDLENYVQINVKTGKERKLRYA